MVEALFNQAGYLAAKKTLDTVVMRQRAIASNIANLETPGYQRLNISQSFQSELQRACASQDAQQIASLQPSIAPDPSAVPRGRDGNTVNLEQEMAELNQNTMLNAVESKLVTYTLVRLKMAVTGKS